MSKEKQIEERSCKKCLHYEMCLDNFRKAKEQGLYELTEEDEYFTHADECDFCAIGYRKQSEGEWVLIEQEDFIYKLYKCSVCGAESFFEADDELCSYCPHCGAKMKGGAK